ncbi:MAG: CehA/McbA family metallohydrolase [Deltaproteobacteria bacterium]|nr:CehA/McbA family metallohydrolase [Deltaproteobacteria bacterium]
MACTRSGLAAVSILVLVLSCSGGGGTETDAGSGQDTGIDAGAPDAGTQEDAGPADAGPPDRDMDGVSDESDPWPDDRCCTADLDGDEICDGRDDDRDGDGAGDFLERLLGFAADDPASFPEVPGDPAARCGALPDADLDGDGVPNASDDDDDGDGVADADECVAGSDPLDARVFPGAKARIPDRCDFGTGTQGPVWLRGDLHMHTTLSDGYEDVATTVLMAEYFSDPAFVARNPAYAGRALNFIAITDHRMIDAVFDPAFVSNRVLLIQAEEFGSDGHANPINISTFIPHEPVAGESPTAAIQRGIDLTHAQGGAFSINHPMSAGDFWFWDVRGYDAAEVWNGILPGLVDVATAGDIDEMEKRHGSVNPVFRLAQAWTADALSEANARFFEANLTTGRFIAPTSGSDRHTMFMPGFPTVWVRAPKHTVEGIVDGIRARHTFVTRSPAAPMVEFEAVAGGVQLLAGDIGDWVPGMDIAVQARVKGAPGGRVELVEGVVLDEAAVLDVAAVPLPRVAAALEIPAEDDAVVTWDWAPARPSWLYARVLERIDLSNYNQRTREWLEEYFRAREEARNPGELVAAMLPFADQDYLLHPDTTPCVPDKTPPWRLECVPMDTKAPGTVFIPEHLDRPFNVVVRDGKATDYALGALTAAVVLKPPGIP